MKRKNTDFIFSVIKYILVYVGVVIILIPIINILLCGFKTTGEVNRVLSMPSRLYFGNYVKVLGNPYAVVSFINSIIITLATLLLNIILCSLAAYPLSRRKERIFGLIYVFFLSAMMIPAVANLSTLYSIILNLGLKDTRTALALIYSSLQIPFGILFYTGFIKTIPRELDEAAIIDGCSYFRRFLKVIFPLLKPVTVAYAVISSITVWNDFLMPLLFISSPEKRPITLEVYSFVSEHIADFGAIYAMLTIAIIPPVVFFLLTQKHFQKGIMIGAVKA